MEDNLEQLEQMEKGEVVAKANKKASKNDEKPVEVSFLETEEYILEQITVATTATHATHPPAGGGQRFAKYSKLNGKTEIVEHFFYNNKLYKPIVNSMTDRDTVKLPTDVAEYIDTNTLIKDIKKYLFDYFEPPKFYDDFLPYYVLFTWVYDKFPFISYLHFVGLTGTGKTVAAETIANICYKPVDAAGSVTIASIFRLADQWRGTLFLDEFDLSSFGKDGYASILTFLKTGVSDRTLLRVEGETKREIQAFSVKSPKIFTSENPITDAGLQSRTFVIKMEKNKRKLPLYKLNNYYDKAEVLRNKLLKWRMENLAKIKLKEIEFGFPELQKFDRRVQQVITPIYLLSDEESRKTILEFAKQQEEETYRERRESTEGQVFQAIADSYPTAPTVSQIIETINKGKPQFKLMTERRLGNIVRKVLGFDIERLGHDNISTVILEEEKYKELTEYYGLSAGESVASVADVAPEDKQKEKETF